MKVSKELKIGVFVIVVLTASFFLINYLRGKDIFNKEIEISSRYADVEGLVASAPVYIKGYKAGKVTEVSYDSSSDSFLVTCSVLKDFRIPEDSKMTIYGVDIMGGKGIKIDLGSSSAAVEDGGFLSSASEPSLLDGLAEGVAPLLDKVSNTLDSLNVTVASVNRLLTDGNIQKILVHMERTMADVRAIAAQLNGKSDELNLLVDNLAILSGKIVGIADKTDSLMSDFSSVVSEIKPEDIKDVVTSFRELLKNINDPDGTIGRLLVDDSVYDSVDGLLNDVDLLVRKIQENPRKYIRISIF